jgi:phage-related protein
MSQLVKTKRQANFKGFKRFGAFKGLVEQKNVVFNSFVCKLNERFKMAHACQKKAQFTHKLVK